MRENNMTLCTHTLTGKRKESLKKLSTDDTALLGSLKKSCKKIRTCV